MGERGEGGGEREREGEVEREWKGEENFVTNIGIQKRIVILTERLEWEEATRCLR